MSTEVTYVPRDYNPTSLLRGAAYNLLVAARQDLETSIEYRPGRATVRWTSLDGASSVVVEVFGGGILKVSRTSPDGDTWVGITRDAIVYAVAAL